MGSIVYAFSEYLKVSAHMGSMMYGFLREVSTSKRMHEVAMNRSAFHKSKPGSLELINPLVLVPGRVLPVLVTLIRIVSFIFVLATARITI